ncbi:MULTISPECIES: hypothetical protein [unclassified Okeania]|nr:MULTISPECIES: hypothetical protein [unclassified Okeania]NET18096.1 hypothetical protein [Okeania sp. SIO1H5]
MSDINLNDLGVRSQESGVSREERRRKRSRSRKFFVCWRTTFLTECYRKR